MHVRRHDDARSSVTRRWIVVPAVVAAMVLPVACGSGSSNAAGPSTTEAGGVSTTVHVPDTPAPSTILPPTPQPGVEAVCSSLAGTVGAAALVPRDTGNWTAERQRVLVDANSDAWLLRRAAEAAPADIAGPLGVAAQHATTVAGELSVATSAVDAIARIADIEPDSDTTARTAVIDGWRRRNC